MVGGQHQHAVAQDGDLIQDRLQGHRIPGVVGHAGQAVGPRWGGDARDRGDLVAGDAAVADFPGGGQRQRRVQRPVQVDCPVARRPAQAQSGGELIRADIDAAAQRSGVAVHVVAQAGVRRGVDRRAASLQVVVILRRVHEKGVQVNQVGGEIGGIDRLTVGVEQVVVSAHAAPVGRPVVRAGVVEDVVLHHPRRPVPQPDAVVADVGKDVVPRGDLADLVDAHPPRPAVSEDIVLKEQPGAVAVVRRLAHEALVELGTGVVFDDDVVHVLAVVIESLEAVHVGAADLGEVRAVEGVAAQQVPFAEEAAVVAVAAAVHVQALDLIALHPPVEAGDADAHLRVVDAVV